MSILAEADEQLRSWLTSIAGDVPVLADAPSDGSVEPALTAYLLTLEPTAALTRGGRQQSSVVVRLRYLVCATAADPVQALGLLDTVVNAALDLTALGSHGVEVDLEPVPTETWIAFGARPRPSFTIRVEARHARQPQKRPMVREPLKLTGGTVRSLTGRLLGPDDVPLTGAEITVMATGAADRTSPVGTFSFGAVPGGGSVRLAVRAKGRMFTADVDPDDEPVVVRCNPLEG
jgi:hypothetical protein